MSSSAESSPAASGSPSAAASGSEGPNGGFVPAARVIASPGAERSAFVLHGALGSGQNWTRFIQRLSEQRPEYNYVLVDLRHHGASRGAAPPNTVRACAEDLVALARARGQSPEVVIGHSFGGKVAVEYARLGSPELEQVWVLDAVLGAQPEHETGEIAQVMRAVRSVPMPAASRRDVVTYLHERLGMSKGLSEWMTTNLRREGDRYEWVFNLDAISELMVDYFQLDLWGYLSEARERPELQLVVAERSDRWTPELRRRAQALPAETRVHYHELENSGHWVHVDNPDGLLGLMAPLLYKR